MVLNLYGIGLPAVLFFLWFSSLALASGAPVFRCVDENGRVLFSDQECEPLSAQELVHVDVMVPSAESRQRAQHKLQQIAVNNERRESEKQRSRKLKKEQEQRESAHKAGMAATQLKRIQSRQCRNVNGRTRCFGPTLFDGEGNVLPESARAEQIDRLKKQIGRDAEN